MGADSRNAIDGIPVGVHKIGPWPDDDVEAIRRVTLADVNRSAKQYLVDQNSITATLKPVPTGEPVPEKGYGGAEEVTSAPKKLVQLPDWAAGALSQLKVPSDYGRASDTVLPNGLRLIVKTDHTSPTISVFGSVRHNADLESPARRPPATIQPASRTHVHLRRGQRPTPAAVASARSA